jgi:hypothetical protein
LTFDSPELEIGTDPRLGSPAGESMGE